MPKLIILNSKYKHIAHIEIEKEYGEESCPSTMTILDIMYKNKITARYGCTGGVCGACLSRLIEGEEYVKKEGKNRAVARRLDKGLFLSCIATIKEEIPKNANIKIKINEN